MEVRKVNIESEAKARGAGERKKKEERRTKCSSRR